jgi:hypothetical protein
MFKERKSGIHLMKILCFYIDSKLLQVDNLVMSGKDRKLEKV